jgi:antitoxin component of MazEF toxin-antitoxin module
MTEVIKLGRGGALVLPRAVLAALSLREGDELIVTLGEDAIVIEPKARRFAQYLDRLGRRPHGRRPDGRDGG